LTRDPAGVKLEPRHWIAINQRGVAIDSIWQQRTTRCPAIKPPSNPIPIHWLSFNLNQTRKSPKIGGYGWTWLERVPARIAKLASSVANLPQ